MNQSWERSQLFVVEELKRIGSCLKELKQGQDKIFDDNRSQMEKVRLEAQKEMGITRSSITLLQFKTSLWGALAGAASSGLFITVVYLFERGKS